MGTSTRHLHATYAWYTVVSFRTRQQLCQRAYTSPSSPSEHVSSCVKELTRHRRLLQNTSAAVSKNLHVTAVSFRTRQQLCQRTYTSPSSPSEHVSSCVKELTRHRRLLQNTSAAVSKNLHVTVVSFRTRQQLCQRTYTSLSVCTRRSNHVTLTAGRHI